ncbi:hypothetical protein NXH62_23430, partial [Klebsiella pneumoniae]|nr:hypothetical protein [Klebsiella pneumoniae]
PGPRIIQGGSPNAGSSSEASMAHQTDEYCLLSRLAEAEQLYGDIIRDWMASPPATKVKNE